MARVTVEDCLGKVDNQFQLVLIATKRARQIANGSEPRVPHENDKPTVIALREIAEDMTTVSVLDEQEDSQSAAGIAEGEVSEELTAEVPGLSNVEAANKGESSEA